MPPFILEARDSNGTDVCNHTDAMASMFHSSRECFTVGSQTESTREDSKVGVIK